MITVRQLDRDWNARHYEKLFRELTAFRPEASFRFEFENNRSTPAAAMALIRLEELAQSHVPLYGRLVRAVLAAQDQRDGGWGDPMVTALCLRALMAGKGNGIAVERGLSFLANLQKEEGAWPCVPIRRMTADGYVSAFILYELGDSPEFREAVRFDDAVRWFERREHTLDERTRDLWQRARLRCRLRLVAHEQPLAMAWS